MNTFRKKQKVRGQTHLSDKCSSCRCTFCISQSLWYKPAPFFLHVQRQPLQNGDQCNLAMINFSSGTAAFQMKTTNEEVRWKISQIRWVQGGWAGGVHPSPAWYKPEHLEAWSLSHILCHANTQNKCSFIDALKWTWHTMSYFHKQNK